MKIKKLTTESLKITTMLLLVATQFIIAGSNMVFADSAPVAFYAKCPGGTTVTDTKATKTVTLSCGGGSFPVLSNTTPFAEDGFTLSARCITPGSAGPERSGSTIGCGTRATDISYNLLSTDAVRESAEQSAADKLAAEQAGGLEKIDDTLYCADGEKGIKLSEGKCLAGFDSDAAGTPLERNPIITYLAIMIRFVMVGVGVIITAVIVIAGIRYTVAKGNPQETAASKDMIQKAIIGLFMYLFSGAIINFLIPGGLI